MSFSRATLARYAPSAGLVRRAPTSSAALSSSSSSSIAIANSSRSMVTSSKPAQGGDHGHGHGAHHEYSWRDYRQHADMHLHEAGKYHVLGAKVFGGLMWFWILYRLKNDWKYLFFWELPWDHAGHDDEHHHHHDDHAASHAAPADAHHH